MKMKRSGKLLCALLAAALLPALARGIPARAAGDVNIRLNGVLTVFREQDGTPLDPIVRDGVIYLPARAIAQAVGMAVEWDPATNTALLGAPCDAPYTPEPKVYVNGAPLPPLDSNGKEVSPVFYYYFGN